MLKRILLVWLICGLPMVANAGPREEAEAVVQKFIMSFNAANNLDEIVGLFAADAQVWGTLSPEMEVGPEAVRKYFAASFSRRATAPSTASVVSSTTMTIADSIALVSGRWQVAGANTTVQNRFSAVIANRGGRWQIVQFHSSPRPQAK